MAQASLCHVIFVRSLTATDRRDDIDKVAVIQLLVKHGLAPVDTQRSHFSHGETEAADQILDVSVVRQFNRFHGLMGVTDKPLDGNRNHNLFAIMSYPGTRTILAEAQRPSCRLLNACAPSDRGRVSTQSRLPTRPDSIAWAAALMSAGV